MSLASPPCYTQVNMRLWVFKCCLFFLQANCIDSTAAPEAVFASEVKKMSAENMKPQEQLTLEPYERDHAVVVGVYRYVQICVTIGRHQRKDFVSCGFR